MAGSAVSDIGAKYVQQVLDRFGYGDGEEDSSEPEEEVDGLTIFSSDAEKALKFELDHCHWQYCRSDSESVDNAAAYEHADDLHGVKNASVECLMERIVDYHIDPNIIKNGEAVIHNFAKQNKYDHILALLLYSRKPCIDINIANEHNGNTPLHIAIERRNTDIVKLLLVFGADVLRKNSAGKSALDAAASMPDMLSILKSAVVQPSKSRTVNRIKKGERMLFLDGGGMRGLLELEVLMEIEKRTGRKIIELFDWLVGTSIGGVICLSIVYAEKTLEEIRQMLLRLRKVFSSGSMLLGAKTRTENMEELLRAWFGDTRMNSKKTPNVMIFTVYKKTTKVQRHCFNNCFDHVKFSTELLWKVARYTTAAAPMYYEEVDNYIDGGYLANNPCQAAWTEIHNYLPKGKKLDPALIVSVGSGIPKEVPMKETSLTNFHQLIDLMVLLITSTEPTAADFESERVRDGTPYFRFNPPDIEVKTLETSAQKLVDMMLSTKQYLQQPEQTKQLEQFVQLIAK